MARSLVHVCNRVVTCPLLVAAQAERLGGVRSLAGLANQSVVNQPGPGA